MHFKVNQKLKVISFETNKLRQTVHSDINPDIYENQNLFPNHIIISCLC